MSATKSKVKLGYITYGKFATTPDEDRATAIGIRQHAKNGKDRACGSGNIIADVIIIIILLKSIFYRHSDSEVMQV